MKIETETNDIGKKSLRGGLVNMGSQAIAVVMQLASVVILARLLAPEAFGVIGMVTAIIGFAGLFKDLGLSAATVQRLDLTQDQVSVLFWINVAMGVGLSFSLIVASPLVAWFYGKPELVWVTIALSCNIAISSLAAQHQAILVRNMRFGLISTARLTGAFTTLVISVVLAWQSWSYWALVAGVLTGSIVSVGMLWAIHPWRPSLPKRGTGVRSMVKYGVNVTGFEFVNYFSRNLDNILIGRVWGADALGLYTRAYALLMVPISNIRTPLAAVSMPALSRLQDDAERFRSYYRQLVGLLAMTTMPIAAFVFVCPDQVIHLLLGPRWLAAAEIARWLALASLLQPVAGVFGTVLMAKGMANRHFKCGMVSSVAISTAFIVGVNWGPVGLAIVYVIVQYLLFVPIFIYASRGTGIRLTDFFQSIEKGLVSSLFAAVGTFGFRLTTDPPLSVVGLLLCGMTFLAIFLSVLLVLPSYRREVFEYRTQFITAMRA